MTRKRRRRQRKRAAAPRSEAGRNAELALRGHFDGRRQWDRVEIAVHVHLSNGMERFAAQTVNLSRTGALFALTDTVFVDAADTLLGYCARVGEAFPDGIRAVFGDGVLTCAMEVVRVTLGGLGGRETPLLACHFERAMTDDECTLLGLQDGRTAPARA